MVKIFITVRNRLEITKKCIEALKQYSTIPHQIYIYDNMSNYRTADHYEYYHKLMEDGQITQITMNSYESTFNAFSKVVACNQFGRLHEDDPKKDEYDFLMFLDNDIIVLPEWDITFKTAWGDVIKLGLEEIKFITTYKGGVVMGNLFNGDIAGLKARVGTHGGSGFWSVRPNFFTDVGFLDVNTVVGHVKQHDQQYWKLLQRAAGTINYGMALVKPMAFHVGGLVGSVCDTLNHGDGNRLEKIKFKDVDEEIGNMTFDEFIDKYSNEYHCIKW